MLTETYTHSFVGPICVCVCVCVRVCAHLCVRVFVRPSVRLSGLYQVVQSVDIILFARKHEKRIQKVDSGSGIPRINSRCHEAVSGQLV